MKVIFKGTAPSETIHRGTCNRCKTIVEFARHEAKYTSDQRDGDYLTVECPECKALIHASVRDTVVGPNGVAR